MTHWTHTLRIEVLQDLADGLSLAEISKKIPCSKSSLSLQVNKEILRMVDAKTTAHAVANAIRQGLIT